MTGACEFTAVPRLASDPYSYNPNGTLVRYGYPKNDPADYGATRVVDVYTGGSYMGFLPYQYVAGYGWFADWNCSTALAQPTAPATTNCVDRFQVNVTNTTSRAAFVSFSYYDGTYTAGTEQTDRLGPLYPGTWGHWEFEFPCDMHIESVFWTLQAMTSADDLPTFLAEPGTVTGTEIYSTNAVSTNLVAAFGGVNPTLGSLTSYTNTTGRADSGLPTGTNAVVGDVVKAVGNLSEKTGNELGGLAEAVAKALDKHADTMTKNQQKTTDAVIAADWHAYTNRLAIVGTLTNGFNQLDYAFTNAAAIANGNATNLLNATTNILHAMTNGVTSSEAIAGFTGGFGQITNAYGGLSGAASARIAALNDSLESFGNAAHRRNSPLRIGLDNGVIRIHPTAGRTIFDGALFYPFATWIRSIVSFLLLAGYARLMLWTITNDLQGLALVPLGSTSLVGWASAAGRLGISIFVLGMLVPLVATYISLTETGGVSTFSSLIDTFLGVPSDAYSPTANNAPAIVTAGLSIALHLLAASVPLELVATLAINYGLYLAFKTTIITGVYWTLRTLGL